MDLYICVDRFHLQMNTSILENFSKMPSENYFIFIPILIVIILWVVEEKFPIYLIIVIACFALYNLKRENDVVLNSLKDAQKLLSEDVNRKFDDLSEGVHRKFDDLSEKIKLLYEEMQQKQIEGDSSSGWSKFSQGRCPIY